MVERNIKQAYKCLHNFKIKVTKKVKEDNVIWEHFGRVVFEVVTFVLNPEYQEEPVI